MLLVKNERPSQQNTRDQLHQKRGSNIVNMLKKQGAKKFGKEGLVEQEFVPDNL